MPTQEQTRDVPQPRVDPPKIDLTDEQPWQPSRQASPPSPPERPKPSSARRSPAAPAGHAIAVAAGALGLAMVFNSAALVKAGEGMKPGATRSLVLSVAHPVNDVAHALYLDRPKQGLDKLFGHDNPTGPSELTKGGAADARPLGQRPSTPAPAAPAPTRVVTPEAPLNLLVTGDSMTEFLGPSLLRAAEPGHKVKGDSETKYGTGLVRPDFFDWSLHARQLMQDKNPEAVVVMMGGNDGQGIRMPDGRALKDGSDEWAKEYRRRAEVVMRAFAGDGKRRVYWVTMPVAKDARLANDYRMINIALADAAAQVPGVKVVDIAGRLSNNGQYSDYLVDDSGNRILARSRDGIHMSQDGARLAAKVVLSALDADWHIGS